MGAHAILHVAVQAALVELDIQAEGLAGSVDIVERDTRIYIVTVRYPVELADGFGPRAYRLLADLVWHSGEGSEAPDAAEGALVRRLVERFGEQLKNVSLLAPEEVVSESIKEHYGEFVTPRRLAEWQREPQKAPGRLTSSPWPERIEVQSVRRQSDTSYEVRGEVIEITSVERAKGGAAAKRPITLTVAKSGEHWLIDRADYDANTGTLDDSRDGTLVYTNDEYSFCFLLPGSWSGYTTVKDEWEGVAVEGSRAGEVVETGPMILIRHPQWTAANPRQDIPIMVFTDDQWNALQAVSFSVGAAPIPPSILGQNEDYVFALPARYNYAFPEGFQEVQEIIEGDSLDPWCQSAKGTK